MKEESLSNHLHLDPFQLHPQLRSHEQDPRNPENCNKGVGGGSICLNFIFNPGLGYANQLSKKQSTCPVLHLFSCQFCGCSLCVRRNEGLCINTTVEQGAYFFPHL